ncbi:MAG: flagellar basal body rod protein FlgC [Bryobacteraceae bacterium]
MSLLSALSVSASGMAAQRTRAELLVQNLANADTTRTPEGGPYRRRDVVFESDPLETSFSTVFDSQIGAQSTGVRVADVLVDTREPERAYMPGHPDADKNGYVALPRISAPEEMVDLLGATRNYEANIAAMSAVKDMIQRSLDLFQS